MRKIGHRHRAAAGAVGVPGRRFIGADVNQTDIGIPAAKPPPEMGGDDPLFVQSAEKAFRVLTAFSAARPTMSLSQLAVATGLEKSAAQRFAHTLERLGYLRKDAHTKHFELTTRTLAPAYRFTQSNPLMRRALPYLV